MCLVICHRNCSDDLKAFLNGSGLGKTRASRIEIVQYPDNTSPDGAWINGILSGSVL